MSGKDLIKVSCRNMEYDCHKDVAVGSVIEPVHQDDKRKYADYKVQTVKPPLMYYIGMIVAFDTSKREMPNSPISGKQYGSLEEIHPRTQAVGAVAMPCKFFECWGKNKGIELNIF